MAFDRSIASDTIAGRDQAQPGDRPDVDSSRTPAPASTLMPPHVLVIDDDPAMRQLIGEYLGENELQVTTVATGAEMLRALAEHPIDLVVLDLRLGGEDGMELARKLRAESAIPIIMVT